jgi:outer membrane protein OmpU
MRKLLLGTSALAAAATLSANVALAADVNITGGTEWTYINRDSGIVDTTGRSDDKFTIDSDIQFSFTNKTDSGLEVGMTILMENGGEDEAYMTVKGGFGSITLGEDDGAGDKLTRTAHDILGPDALNDGGGYVGAGKTDFDGTTVTGTDYLSDDNADLITDINDANNITYMLPKLGGLQVGVSYADAGAKAAQNGDTTVVGATYEFESGAVKGTLHYGNANISGASAGDGSRNSNSMAIDVSSGPFRAVLAKAQDDRTTAIQTTVTDYGISYNLGSGLTIAAVGTQVEENTGGETIDATSISAKYSITSGLDAYLTYHDYDYTAGTSGAASSRADDDGSYTQLTIKATF